MMKRIGFLRRTFLTVSASALMLGASYGAAIGINFQGSGYSYVTGYTSFGVPVTTTAFGIAPANWHNTGQGTNDGASGNETYTPVSGASLTVAWNSANTWVSDAEGGSTAPATGEGQVEYAYLDDGPTSGSIGYTITISGLSSFLAANSASGYTIQLVGASQSALALGSASLISIGGTQTLSYLTTNSTQGFLAELSTLSTNLTDDSITINSGSRPGDGTTRDSLAGVIITPVAAPEPSAALMLLAGSGLLFMRKRRNR